MKKTLRIEGLDCANCARKFEESVNKIDDVVVATVNFMTGKLMIECTDDKEKEVIEEVKKRLKSIERHATLVE